MQTRGPPTGCTWNAVHVASAQQVPGTCCLVSPYALCHLTGLSPAPTSPCLCLGQGHHPLDSPTHLCAILTDTHPMPQRVPSASFLPLKQVLSFHLPPVQGSLSLETQLCLSHWTCFHRLPLVLSPQPLSLPSPPNCSAPEQRHLKRPDHAPITVERSSKDTWGGPRKQTLPRRSPWSPWRREEQCRENNQGSISRG